MNINLLAVLSFINFVVCFLLALTFLIYGKNKLHRTYGYFHLSVAIWAFFVTLACTTSNPSQAYFFWQYSHVFGIYISIFFAHSVYQFCSFKYSIFVPLIYFYGLLSSILYTYKNGYLINDGVNLLFNNIYYLDVDNTYFLLATMPWFILAIWGNTMLYQYFREREGDKSRTALIILVSSLIGYVGGTSSFIPMFGFHSYYPVTIILISAYGVITSYGVFRHQILELNIIIERGLTYSILLTLASLAYITLILISEQIFSNTFGYSSWLIKLIIVLIIASIFAPLRDWIQSLIDKLIYKATPQQLVNENQALRKNATQSEKMRMIATLASGIAHEIRNPLTALKTFIEYFPSKKNDPQFLAKFESIASTEITRIEQIVNELLEFAKPSPLTLKDTNIQKVLEHALSLTANQLQKSNVTAKTVFAPNLPLIKADSNKLLQVSINLILNAIDAMPTGGILTVTTSQPPPLSPPNAPVGGPQQNGFPISTFGNDKVAATSSQNPAPRSLIISITDTGFGISKENLKQIFEPFFSTKEKGTGLGLAIAKGILEDHGGHIEAESKEGNGTTFRIRLPDESIKDVLI